MSHPGKLTEPQRQELVAAYLHGEPWQSLAARFGISKEAISYLLRTRADGPNRRYNSPPTVTIENVEWVLECEPYATTRRLADRPHLSMDVIQQTLKRAGRRDLLDRLARNHRIAEEGAAA